MAMTYTNERTNNYAAMQPLLDDFKRLNAATDELKVFIEEYKSSKIKEDIQEILDSINSALWCDTPSGDDTEPALLPVLRELAQVRKEQAEMRQVLVDAMVYTKSAADEIRRLQLERGQQSAPKKNEKEPTSVEDNTSN